MKFTERNWQKISFESLVKVYRRSKVLFVLPFLAFNLLTITRMASADVDLSNSVSQFSADIYSKATEESTGNIIISPLSIQTALALAYLGARGETESSLATTLRLPSKNRDEVSSKFQQLLQSIQSNPALKIANKVYVMQNYVISPDFNRLAVENFDSETESVDFSKTTETSKTINAWVESKTNDKIHDLITPDSIDALTRMVLVNAIYFKGEWLHKFQVSDTKQEPFWTSETDSSNVDMMHIKRNFKYGVFDDLDATGIELPFSNGNISMFVILPNKRTGLSALEEQLKTVNLNELSEKLYSTEVVVSLPKFKIEYSLSVKAALEKLGLSVIFSDAADFSGLLTSPEPLKVSDVVHKAFIEVNEEGAEAAAATGVVMMMRCAPMPAIHFKADHSFFYLLRDYALQSNLFVGRFSN